MIGNYVTIKLVDGLVDWVVLHKISEAGVCYYINKGLDQGTRFVPMSRVVEIKDLGRAP